MRIEFKGLPATTLALICAGMLTACGNLSRGVAHDGMSAETLVWPSPGDTIAIHRGGTYPSVSSLRQVMPGLDKLQIAALIGFPHFNEGVWKVREWDYLFHFRTPRDHQVTTCQFKILFDDKRLARSFHWSPQSCARFVAGPAASTRPAVQTFDLSTETLFRFARASVTDIKPDGLKELDEVASKLKEHLAGIRSIEIIGYTDRLGTESYNKTLSERRAYAVFSYLIGQGIPSDKVVVEGYGELDPVRSCPDTRGHAELIACLAPNRRVVVRAID